MEIIKVLPVSVILLSYWIKFHPIQVYENITTGCEIQYLHRLEYFKLILIYIILSMYEAEVDGERQENWN